MDIRPGDLILAEPFMKDPNFKRTVVLVCEHNDEGAFGLVLNRRLEISVDHVLPEFPADNIELFYGGPVGADTLHFIHSYGDLIEGSIPLQGDLAWGGNFEQVKMLLETQSVDKDRFRFFIGYSGWGPGQLEDEMEGDSWIVTGGFSKVLIPADRLWENVLRHMGGDYRFVSTFPEDPQLN